MSNPRITKYGQRTNWHKPAPKLDSPTFHGWTRCGTDEATGFSVFQLGCAFARVCTIEEKFQSGNDYYVNIGANCYGFSGSWERVTQEVRKMLDEIPFRGEPIPQPESDDNGLLPVA